MRKSSVAFVGLLLAGIFLPNAAKASGDDLLLQITAPKPAMTAASGADCKASLQPGLPGGAIFLQTGNGCGACSDTFCQGSTIGNYCAKGIYYTCQNALGLECPAQPTLWQCTCWPPNTPFP
jgi:hypothetical protein